MKSIYVFLVFLQVLSYYSVAAQDAETVTTAAPLEPEVPHEPTQDVVTAQNGVLENAGDNVLLSCIVSEPTNSVMKWYKNGVEIADDSKGHTKHTNNSLEVLKVGSDDVGIYFCVITVSGKVHNVSVQLLAAPQVKHFEPSTKNLVQGDPLVLECNMWGWPHPVVSWAFNHSALNVNDTRIKVTANSHGVANGKLRLEDVDYPDGGIYECVGTNGVHSNSSSVTVVIKNKYAALWPFLGICVEVAVLCIIIFIYERRHAKKLAQQEEEEAKQEEAVHLAGNEKFDDVRHRDVKA